MRSPKHEEGILMLSSRSSFDITSKIFLRLLFFNFIPKSGKASKEVLESIEGNVLKGGGVYEKNGITNETTHAILVAKQVGEAKTF